MSHRVPEEHKFCMVAEHQETCHQEVRTCSSVDVSFVFRLALPIDMLCLKAHFSFSFLHFLISYFLFPHFLISHFLISHSLFYNNPANTQLVLVILCHRGVAIEPYIRRQIAPKVIKSTVFDKMGRSSKEEASLTPVS